MIHYDAVYGIFQYLSGTRNAGLTYTRPEPSNWVPVVKDTPLRSQPTDIFDEHFPTENLHMPITVLENRVQVFLA
jgi:hypothetical protein